MSHQSLRLRAAERRRHRDRINAHGPELLDALKELVGYADVAFPTSTALSPGELLLAADAVGRAQGLINKLDGNSTEGL